MKEVVFNLPQAKLKLYEQFFSDEDYFDQLKNTITWEEKEIVLFGKKIMQPRLVAFYGNDGISYKYSGQSMVAKAWNDVLQEIKEKIKTDTGLTFNSCLLNYYRDGNDSMGWHQDNEKELGVNPVIASASFGGERLFKLKHVANKNVKQDVVLRDGSLFIMADETQHYYRHALPKTKRFMVPRINLTFRNIL